MYRKNKNNWVKHLDFMILDLICLQVAFFLAYTLRHRTVNLYTNYKIGRASCRERVSSPV